jgi:hypothetical protein
VDTQWYSPNRQIASAVRGQLHVTVLGRGEWTDADWRSFVMANVEHGKAYGWPTAALSFSSGHAPNATQRRMSVELVPKEGLAAQKRIALLSDSAIMRMSMNAWGMVTRQVSELKAFRPIHHAQAFAWLGEKEAIDAPSSLAVLRDLLAGAGFDPRVLDADWKSKVAGE